MPSAALNAPLAPIVVRHALTREPIFTCYVSGDYRIATMIAIVLVVVLSNVIFAIHPLTAIMIVVLALLDDTPPS